MRFHLSDRKSPEAAFTLVEVILAVGIAIGVLVTVLSFYQQAAELRGQILEETHRVSAIRLLTDQLTTDLRSARAHDWHGFTGSVSTVRFVKTDALSAAAWNREGGQTDLQLVSYGAAVRTEGTNNVVTGIVRTQQPLIEFRTASGGRGGEIAVVTNAVAAEPVTDALHYLHFRYWDGQDWVESWDAITPPRALEVSFGVDPAPDDGEDYAGEYFRRIILLPGGKALPVSESTKQKSLEPRDGRERL